MEKKQQNRSAKFKLRVGLEAIKGQKTLNQIGSENQVNPSLVSKWKKQILDQGGLIFERGATGRKEQEQAKEEARLYEQIGRLKMEWEWVKKKAEMFD